MGFAAGIVVTLAAFANSHAAELAQERVQRAATPKPVVDFELTDQLGKPRKFSNFRGAPVLVFFGFTNCPDVCPTSMQQLKLLKQSQDRDLRRAQVVMISVDGGRDTPAQLKAYLEPMSKSFVGLTGPPLKVRGIAAQFSAVFFKGAPSDKSGAYKVEHTSQVYLVDSAGNLRATFFNAPLETLRSVTKEIAKAG
jgi:protein SCO1/2